MKGKLAVGFTLILVIAILMVCNRNKKIEFDFKVDDIECIEMYSYVMPTEAEKKIITERSDIEQIINSISELKIKGEASAKDESVGYDILSLRFKLKNQGSMEVIYNKSGVITSSYVFSYKTEGEFMKKLWDKLDYEINKATVEELPKIER